MAGVRWTCKGKGLMLLRIIFILCVAAIVLLVLGVLTLWSNRNSYDQGRERRGNTMTVSGLILLIVYAVIVCYDLFVLHPYPIH